MKSPFPEADRRALDEVCRQIEHARFNLSHADTKASLLAAGTIPVTALLLAAPSLTNPLGLVSAFAWTSAAFMLTGIGFLGTVVWPRLGGNGGIRAVAHRSAGEIVEQIMRRAKEPQHYLEEMAVELSILATLAFDKFRRLQRAMVCFAVAAVFLIVAAIAFVVGS